MNQQMLLQDLIKARNSIKRKFNALRQSKTESDALITDVLKPVTEPLHELVKAKKIKSEPKIKNEHPFKIETSTPQKKIEADSSIFHSYKNESEDEESFENTLLKSKNDSKEKSFENENTLLKRIRNKNYDKMYGPYYNEGHDTIKIGTKNLRLENDKVEVGTLAFKSTPGLLNLLFNKNPDDYTAEDVSAYKQIISHSNLHRDTDSDKQPILRRKRENLKYKKFMADLSSVTPSASGNGLLNRVSNKKSQYIYFNDYNEIIERLKLLIASKNAGNNSMDNEINSIIEELKEAKIIV